MRKTLVIILIAAALVIGFLIGSRGKTYKGDTAETWWLRYVEQYQLNQDCGCDS